MFLQMIDLISITAGKPVMLYPLTFVVAVSMIKDISEDYKRYKSDQKENYRKVLLLNAETGKFEERNWEQLHVGNLVKVMEGQYFPADLILLKSADKNGQCYVETKSLDGETNLKTRQANKQMVKMMAEVAEEEYSSKVSGVIQCELPNDQIYKFEGTYENKDIKTSLNFDNFLHRGSSLRNTEWIIGVPIYAGHSTKVMMNSSNSRYKRSDIEVRTNKLIILILIIQFALCIVAATYGTVWNYTQQIPYIKEKDNSPWEKNRFLFFVKTGGTWLLLFANFIPISLLLTLELAHYFQGMFIEWDWMMYFSENDQPAIVQASNLNEELGQVEYVFSDKTGTLTCNQMVFMKFSAGDHRYSLEGDPLQIANSTQGSQRE